MSFPFHVIRASRGTDIDYSKFSVCPSSIYSSLMPWQVPQLRAILKDISDQIPASKEPLKVIDGTAHIGCDTINFYKFFQQIKRPVQITAIEMDKSVMDLLRKNLIAFSIPATTLNLDVIEAIKTLPFDSPTLLYLDPPWGGRGYRQTDKMNLELSGVPISNIVCYIYSRPNSENVYLLIKVPKNFDIRTFNKEIIVTVSQYDLKKPNSEVIYSLLFLKKTIGLSPPPTGYPSLIGSDKREINFVLNSPHKADLLTLFRKRVGGVPVNMGGLTDIDIYEKLNRTSLSNGDWGITDYDPTIITGRAQNRINDFKRYLDTVASRDKLAILDIGAGNGEILVGIGNYLKLFKQSLWAMDITNTIPKGAINRVSFEQLKENEPIWNGDTEKFNVIILFQTMHHMRDLESKLSDVVRLLKKDGFLFIREHDCGDETVAKLIDIEHVLYDVVLGGKAYPALNYFGTVYRSRDEWTTILEKHGLKLVEYLTATTGSNPTNYYNAVYVKEL